MRRLRAAAILASLALVARAVSAPARATEGPAELTIQIVYFSNGLPSSDMLYRRQGMGRCLEAEGAGERIAGELGYRKCGL